MILHYSDCKNESCNKMGKDYYEQRRGSSTQRGYGSRWQRVRLAYLRVHPLCVMCEREGKITAATVVDHKIAHKGDQALLFDTHNFQSLCKPHHDRDKQREERGRSIQRVGADGWPVE